MRAKNLDALTIIWKAALICFCVAGVGGVLFRGVMLGWSPLGLDPINLRHGHSHLMVFGWLTPGLFTLIARHISLKNKMLSLKPFLWVISGSLALASLSFPFFTLYGYGPTPLAGLPLSTIISGLNMLTWYAFVVVYFYAARNMPHDLPMLFWDGALTFLVLSSFGAWGISLLHLGGSEAFSSPKALTHWFLFLFKEGWCVPALLGLVFATLELRHAQSHHVLALVLIFAGLPLAVPLGMPAWTMGEIFPFSTRIGAGMVAVGLGQILLELLLLAYFRKQWFWLAPLGFLSLKSLAMFAAALLPLEHLTTHHGVGILYLHVLLLGGLSLGLAAGARYAGLPMKQLAALTLCVFLLILSLLPFTPFWPTSWMGPQILYAAFWLAMPPIICVLANFLPGRGLSTSPCFSGLKSHREARS